MHDVPGRVLDYLGYKNKIRTAQWAERLWRQHLDGTPRDFREAADRERYGDLLRRIERSRQLARNLHQHRRQPPMHGATQGAAAG